MKKSLLFVILLSGFFFAQEYKSVHQMQSEEFRIDKKKTANVENISEQIIPLNPSKTNQLTAKVFGFLPDWEYPTAKSYLQYDLLTHIAAFDFAVSNTGAISNPSYWPWTDVINAAHTAGVKVVMAVTNFDADDIRTIITDSNVKSAFFANVVTKINTYNLDGVNIDFEGPYTADRGTLMNTFMTDLTTYIHTNLPGKEVSFDGPVVNWSGWNFTGLASSCDYIFIMGYDFFGSWSTTTGPSSPLSGGTYNVGNSITNTSWGYGSVVSSTPEKLILGIPYYGCHWTTQTSSAGSATIDYIASVRFRSCFPDVETYGRIWNSTYQVPWYTYQLESVWHQVWYDDEESLGLKYDLAINKNLLGVGMWALGYDGSRSELWDLLKEKFYASVPVELQSFNVEQSYSKISIEWKTATETNNFGFEIQRAVLAENEDAASAQFATIRFVKGAGTTTEPNNYSYQDDIRNINSSKIAYCIKQVDVNGSYKIYDAKVINVAPYSYSLSQNYPNPFNPETKIEFQLPFDENVTLKVFDVLGREAATLLSEPLTAGFHSVNFNAGNLTTGVYFYKLKTNNFTETKKMVIAK